MDLLRDFVVAKAADPSKIAFLLRKFRLHKTCNIRCSIGASPPTPKLQRFLVSTFNRKIGGAMKKNFIRLVLSFSALLVFTSMALAQNTGTISGTVQDQSGAVVAGANVKSQNPATNFSREATSATNGFYRFDQLPVGTYTVSVEAAGFKKSVTQGVALSVNDALTLEFKLE